MFLAVTLVCPAVHAQQVRLPPAGEKVALSDPFQPAVLAAVTVDPKEPLRFQFYVDPGQPLQDQDRQKEYLLLIKDFMTALTLPEGQLWVNLSPYEKDRIIDDRFGLTEMGRDFLAQDYLLKQITASLIYPEEGIGKSFWDELYRRSQDEFGTTDIPVDAFNKVWIMPDVAEVYQQGTSAVVLKAHLKVMLEADYLALKNNLAGGAVLPQDQNAAQELTKTILREVIVPLLEKEVNEGRNFARLRQIYNSLILASWYKKTMRETFLGKFYVDQSKVRGVEQQDAGENLRIYDQYVEAFRKGVFNYVKEEIDRYSGEVVPRKYLSGGVFIPQDFAQRILVVRDVITEEQRKDFAEKNKLQKVDSKFESVMRVAQKLPILRRIDEFNQQYLTLYNSTRDELFSVDEKALLKQYETQLISLSEQYISEVLSGEKETKELVMEEVVRPLLKGGWSSARSLLFNGAHIDEASRYFLVLAKLARKDADIPYIEIFNMLHFSNELSVPLANKLKKLKTVADYQFFYEQLFDEVVPSKSKFKESVYTAVDKLEILRQKSKVPYWNAKLGAAKEGRQQKLIDDMIKRQRDTFLNAIKIVLKLVPGAAANFLRVKSADSIREKLYRGRFVFNQETFEMVDKDLTFSSFFDLTGAKIIINGNLSAFEKHIQVFDSQCIKYDDWLKKIAEEKQEAIDDLKEIDKELKATKGASKEKMDAHMQLLAARPEVENKIKDIKRRESNLIDIDGKYVLFRKENRYVSSKGDEKTGHYKGTNYVIAKGEDHEVIEVQFHNFLTVMYDADHLKIYKAKINHEPEIQLKDDLLKTIWLSHIIEALAYAYPKSNSVRKKILDLLTDQAEQVGAEDDVLFKNDLRTTGGIDVRDVDGVLDVRGDRTALFADIPAGGLALVEGFSPSITAVTAVEGLPFLQERSLPKGVFSRN